MVKDTIQSVSDSELRAEIERVIAYWKQLNEEWEKRLQNKLVEEMTQPKLWTPRDIVPDDPPPSFTMPPDPDPSPPDNSSSFDGGGGESGGAGATGDW